MLCFADDSIDPVASDDAKAACWVDVETVLKGEVPPGETGSLIAKTGAVVEAALALADRRQEEERKEESLRAVMPWF